MERDEVYVPETRSDLGIPNAPPENVQWEEIFDDAPLYTLYMLVRRQLLAFPAYLCELLLGDLSIMINNLNLTYPLSYERFRTKVISLSYEPLRSSVFQISPLTTMSDGFS